MKQITLVLALLLIRWSSMVTATTTHDSIVSMIPRDTAVYRYGYLELNTQNRALYDTIVGSLIRFEANYYAAYQYHRCDLSGISNQSDITWVKNALARVQNDIPELFILNSYIPRYDYQDYIYYARIGYLYTPNNYLQYLQQMRQAYEDCTIGVNDTMSVYQKILILHDNYCRRTTYGDMTGAEASSAKGSLINQRAICEGIARGWLYICQQAGIPCIYVAGQLLSQGNHAWNYTMIDGKWYMMDVTADCSLVTKPGHSGFLKGSTYQSAHYSLYYANGTDANCDGVYQSLPVLEVDDYDPTKVTTTATIVPNQSATHHKTWVDGRLMILSEGRYYTILGQFIR